MARFELTLFSHSVFFSGQRNTFQRVFGFYENHLHSLRMTTQFYVYTLVCYPRLLVCVLPCSETFGKAVHTNVVVKKVSGTDMSSLEIISGGSVGCNLSCQHLVLINTHHHHLGGYSMTLYILETKNDYLLGYLINFWYKFCVAFRNERIQLRPRKQQMKDVLNIMYDGHCESFLNVKLWAFRRYLVLHICVDPENFLLKIVRCNWYCPLKEFTVEDTTQKFLALQ